MTELNMEVFPDGWWQEFAPKGSTISHIDVETDGTIVAYGDPDKDHNCDVMGCPSTDHVLFILKGNTKETKKEL